MSESFTVAWQEPLTRGAAFQFRPVVTNSFYSTLEVQRPQPCCCLTYVFPHFLSPYFLSIFSFPFHRWKALKKPAVAGFTNLIPHISINLPLKLNCSFFYTAVLKTNTLLCFDIPHQLNFTTFQGKIWPFLTLKWIKTHAWKLQHRNIQF